MGDRGNIVIKEGQEQVWLYSHWSGSSITSILQRALARKQRWDDAPYLARIIFDTMTEGSHGSETGYGIWTCPLDNEHDILLVDVKAQKVLVMPYGWDGNSNSTIKPINTYTFDEYIALKELPEV
jgi:hypothetical protein